MGIATKMLLGILVVFIATFMLFYIFDNLNKLAEKCKTGEINFSVCHKLSGFTLSMLVILLIISGFIFVILVTSYILLSTS